MQLDGEGHSTAALCKSAACQGPQPTPSALRPNRCVQIHGPFMITRIVGMFFSASVFQRSASHNRPRKPDHALAPEALADMPLQTALR